MTFKCVKLNKERKLFDDPGRLLTVAMLSVRSCCKDSLRVK